MMSQCTQHTWLGKCRQRVTSEKRHRARATQRWRLSQPRNEINPGWIPARTLGPLPYLSWTHWAHVEKTDTGFRRRLDVCIRITTSAVDTCIIMYLVFLTELYVQERLLNIFYVPATGVRNAVWTGRCSSCLHGPCNEVGPSKRLHRQSNDLSSHCCLYGHRSQQSVSRVDEMWASAFTARFILNVIHIRLEQNSTQWMLTNRISNTEGPLQTDVRFLRPHLIKAHFLAVI